MDSPFTVLAAIVAPAVLTNACSILTLGMSNRLARVVDRTRVVLSELARDDIPDLRRHSFTPQLADLRRRTTLLLAAQRWFFIALGSFAVVALLSVVSLAGATGRPRGDGVTGAGRWDLRGVRPGLGLLAHGSGDAPVGHQSQKRGGRPAVQA